MTTPTLKVSDSLSLPLDYVTKTAAILAQRRKGKRLSLDTQLVTPSGWTTMGEVLVGDLLFDEWGQACTVTYVGPVAWGHAYRVTFSDGSSIIADAEHLWLTHTRLDRRARRPTTVRTTTQIAETLIQGGERNHYVPVARPLHLPDAELPIDPYTLGIWLGDGTRGTGYFTTTDSEIVEYIRGAGYQVRRQEAARRMGRAPTYLIVGIRPHLRALGCLRDKRVPETYLRSSERQRLALLQGLMDSDGSIGHSQPQAEFAVTSEVLAEGVYELLVSLGQKATRTKRPALLNGIEHGVSFRFQFTPTTPVFRLRRKAERLRVGSDWASLRSRSVVSIERTVSVPMRCISVDSPSCLYLAGESMIPTHNTYTASVIAEELVAAGQPWVALDPTGAWWGLRSSADGEKPGLPVVILGGQHGDAPLERGAGRYVAELVVESPGWYVLDLSLFESRSAEREFATDFGEALIRRKRQPGRDFPMHLFVDEADMFAPQEKEGAGDQRMLGAYQAIVRRGGLAGLGSTLISQRPALLNKSVLTQLDLLILLRLVAGQDQDAVDKNYLSRAGGPSQRAELMGSLASLRLGEAWLWEPGAEPPLFERLQIRQRRTFNSSATPKPGERQLEPRQLAAVDLDAVKEAMAAAIDRAKADDPKELRRRIAGLEKELREVQAATPEPVERVEVEVPALDAATLADLKETVGRLAESAGDVARVTDVATDALRTVEEALERDRQDLSRGGATGGGAGGRSTPGSARSQPVDQRSGASGRQAASGPIQRADPPGRRQLRGAAVPGTEEGQERLGKGERTVLGVLAQYPQGRTYGQLAFLAGYSAKASTLGVILAKLRRLGLVNPGGSDLIALTPEGLGAAGGAPEQLSGRALLDHWRSHPRMGEGERRVLDALIESYPDALTHDELCEVTGYSPSASTIGVILSKLRKLGLVEKGARRIADEFMEAIR